MSCGVCQGNFDGLHQSCIVVCPESQNYNFHLHCYIESLELTSRQQCACHCGYIHIISIFRDTVEQVLSNIRAIIGEAWQQRQNGIPPTIMELRRQFQQAKDLYTTAKHRSNFLHIV